MAFFYDFRVFRLLNKRSIRGHPLHIFQKNHKTTIILVQEDVDGPKRIPLFKNFSSSLQNQPVWDVLLFGLINLHLGQRECRRCFSFQSRKKNGCLWNFEKRKTAIVFKSILSQRYGLVISHHPYLTHMSVAVYGITASV